MNFPVFNNNYIKKVSENFNVQFSAEFFNILNHANCAPPTSPDNTDILNATGAPTGVTGPAEPQPQMANATNSGINGHRASTGTA